MEKHSFPSSLQECFTYQKGCYCMFSGPLIILAAFLCVQSIQSLSYWNWGLLISQNYLKWQLMSNIACYKLFTCVHCSTEQRHQYLASTSGHPYKALNSFSTSKPQRNLTENLETVNFPSISVLDHGAFISKYLLPLSNLPHANGA